MSDRHVQSLADLTGEVLEAVHTTGYALMKANYVEQSAPFLPGGTVEGLRPQARDVAVEIRDSIRARFESLSFHHHLLARVHQGHAKALEGTPGSSEEEFRGLWRAAWQEQFLFDDLVFNAASLFDYLACAIWFGFHGRNHRKKKWNDVTSAAREPGREPDRKDGSSIHGSLTGRKALAADRDFVGDLSGYRADLIHHRVDAGKASSGYKVKGEDLAAELSVSLPANYAKAVKALVPEVETTESDPELTDAGAHLIARVGRVTLELLEALQDDLDWDEDESLVMLS